MTRFGKAHTISERAVFKAYDESQPASLTASALARQASIDSLMYELTERREMRERFGWLPGAMAWGVGVAVLVLSLIHAAPLLTGAL